MAKRLDFARPHLLRNEEEYDAAVAEIDELLDLDPRQATEEHDRLEFLSVLVEAYDDEHYPMRENVSAEDLVGFMLEQKGMARSDLNDAMGGKARVSEFFAGKRPLSLRQMRALHDLLGIPIEPLVIDAWAKADRRTGT